MEKQQPLQILKVASEKLALGQLTFIHLKTSCSLLQRPPVGLSQTQTHCSRPGEGVACCCCSAPSEAEQGKVTTIQSTDKEIRMNIPSRRTQNGRTHVAIQTISPVPLANSIPPPPPKKERKRKTMDALYWPWIRCISKEFLFE